LWTLEEKKTEKDISRENDLKFVYLKKNSRPHVKEKGFTPSLPRDNISGMVSVEAV
jgi:hypothetical protein